MFFRRRGAAAEDMSGLQKSSLEHADARKAEAADKAHKAEEDAAAESARQAKQKGGGEDAVLDAMVEAEEEFNARHSSAGQVLTSDA